MTIVPKTKEELLNEIHELKREISEFRMRGKSQEANKKSDSLLDYLKQVAEEVSRRKYSRPDKIFELSKTNIYPDKISDLAESFGMMIVKVEAREIRLQRAVDRLRKSNDALKSEIVERKAAYEAINIFLDLFNNIDTGLCVYHIQDFKNKIELKLVAANPTFINFNETFKKVSPENSLEKNLYTLRKNGLTDVIAEMRVENKSITVGDIQCNLDSVSTIWLSVKAFPLSNNCVGVAFNDITERRKAEESRQKIIEKLHKSLDNI